MLRLKLLVFILVVSASSIHPILGEDDVNSTASSETSTPPIVSSESSHPSTGPTGEPSQDAASSSSGTTPTAIPSQTGAKKEESESTPPATTIAPKPSTNTPEPTKSTPSPLSTNSKMNQTPSTTATKSAGPTKAAQEQGTGKDGSYTHVANVGLVVALLGGLSAFAF